MQGEIQKIIEQDCFDKNYLPAEFLPFCLIFPLSPLLDELSERLLSLLRLFFESFRSGSKLFSFLKNGRTLPICCHVFSFWRVVWQPASEAEKESAIKRKTIFFISFRRLGNKRSASFLIEFSIAENGCLYGFEYFGDERVGEIPAVVFVGICRCGV